MIAALILLICLLLYVLLKRGRTTTIIPIKGKEGIAELKSINIGNSKQWILIRSENTENPVILFVHGGPGTSQLTLLKNNTKDIEKHFIVVGWDQRGAGKSFNAAKNLNDMNINRFVSDIIEAAEYLIKKFNKKKIILAGHSWGTIISTLAAYRRPDLFSVYIGIGQIANMAEGEAVSYEWTLKQAQLAGDNKAINTLKKIGNPPYTGNWKKKTIIERRLLAKYGGEYHGSSSGAFSVILKSIIFSIEYTFIDRINFFRGMLKSVGLLFPQMLKVNFFELVPELKIPVWFMCGRYDYEVPSVLSEKYYEFLKAPAKHIVWFEKSAHMPNVEEKYLFNKILVENIREEITDD
jgi:pimeloyl-ACP methyl ester carboxylesterase